MTPLDLPEPEDDTVRFATSARYPYAVLFAAWVALPVLASAALLSFAPGRRPDTIEALARSPGFLLLGAGLSSMLLLSVGWLAASRPPGPRPVTARLGIRPVGPAPLALAALGTWSASVFIESAIHLFGLSEVGALFQMRAALEGLEPVSRVGAAVFLGLLPGLGEEVFFRGFLLRRFAAHHGAPVALVVSAVAFGAFHFDPVHSPAAAALGIYLGLVVLATGSLVPAIVAHAVNNALATLLVGLPMAPGSHGLLMVAGLSVALVCLGRLLLRPPVSTDLAPW